MARLEQCGLTINEEKSVFGMTSLLYMGHQLSEAGLKIDNFKVKAVVDCEAPTSVSEVKSFLGLAQYCSKFIPDFASVTDPLWELTRADQKFEWSKRQQNAFDKVKSLITEAPTLSYYNQKAKTRLITDASPVGLGAILEQEQSDGSYRPVMYASRSLTEVERRYAQFEKEALGIVWAVEHFHLYLLGVHFEIRTDHKPLVHAYGPNGNPPARVQRFALRLQPYSFDLKHVDGKSNVADYLSRFPLHLESKEEICYQHTEEYIYSVVTGAIPSALTAKQVECVSAKDSELSSIRSALLCDDWSNVPQEYRNVRHELSSCGQIILRGTRIVIPVELRAQVIAIGHEGHQGIVKMKGRLRECVWWPGIDKDITQFVQGCHSCQVVGHKPTPEPLIPTPLPPGPWVELGMDLLEIGNDHLFVVIDYYSRWSEVAFIRDIKTFKVIRCLEIMFNTHGLPMRVRTDNGPQFTAEDFEKFCENLGIEQIKGIPYWPPSNGEVENHNKTLLKIARIAKLEKRDLRPEVEIFLFSYRTTLHCTTGMSPAELLFGRKLRIKLPSSSQLEDFVEEDSTNQRLIDMRANDAMKKLKNKQYADSSRRARVLDVEAGDQVLLKYHQKLSKLTPTYEETPYEVLEKKGNALILKGEDGSVKMRNSAHVKKFEKIPQHLQLQPDLNLSADQTQENLSDEHVQPPTPEIPEPSEPPKPPDIPVITPTERPQRERRAPKHFDSYELYNIIYWVLVMTYPCTYLKWIRYLPLASYFRWDICVNRSLSVWLREVLII